LIQRNYIATAANVFQNPFGQNQAAKSIDPYDWLKSWL